MHRQTDGQTDLVPGWVDGWMDGWVDGEAGLRIAYSNQKQTRFTIKVTLLVTSQDPVQCYNDK